ncbi:hypothetical protein [Streptomyces sp. TLI_105]|uniref:hypothetical protein n=1 Tax=Streptomyces sp. TLI_105 TaxID=1881019 RepID=UPI000896D2D8|nr:hypothetical protein [Streptomyces sp. TLI_105]SEB58727.1 hypothetical protein SAMN05428939_0090 [Streptomyces sp. TLI_105]
MHLDRLIGTTAAGEYVPLYLPVQPGRRTRAAHMGVSAEDHDATSDELTEPPPGHVDDNNPAEPERLPFSRSCSYQARQEQDPRGDVVRDTDALMPAGITLPDPRTGLRAARQLTSRPVTAADPSADAAGIPSLIPLQPGPQDRNRARQASVPAGAPDYPSDLAGPCAVCRMPTHRYGIGGKPAVSSVSPRSPAISVTRCL